MKLLMYFMILKLGIIITTASATLSTKDHVNLISDVFSVYKPSSLTFVHFADYYQNWTQMNLIVNTQLLLSRKNIKTLIVNFEDVSFINSSDLCNNMGIKTDPKPMSVFFLTSEKAIKEMKKLPKIYLSKLINLVLFVKIDESLSTEFCMKPFGNPFLLRSDLFFLVKCHEDSIIREWQPLNSKEMKVFERATWEPETGLVLKSENLEFKEITQLNGKVLFTGIVQDYEKLIHYTDSILFALQLAGNFTAINIETSETYGIWDESNKTWSGGYGLIVHGKVDLMASLYIMTPRRISIVDYTIPIKKLEMYMCIRKQSDQTTVSWTAYFKPFSYGVWTAMLLLFIAIHTFLTFMKARMRKSFGHEKFVLENYLHVWGCYCQQGLSEFPTSTSLRLAYSSTFLFAFCILSIYSACFVSDLAIIVEDVSFKSLEDFVKDGSYKLAIFQDSEYYDFFQDATNSPWREMNQLLLNREELPLTIEDAANMICHGNVALLADNFIFSVMESTVKPCHVTKLKIDIHVNTGMILSKESPYTKVINYHISRLRETGILKYFDSILDIQTFHSRSKPEKKYKSATFWHITPLLAIIVGGVVLAALVLCFEKVYYDWIDKIKCVNT